MFKVVFYYNYNYLSSYYVFLNAALTAFQPTWWHIGEVAASQRLGRGSNFQIRAAVSAGILPLSRQYARWALVFCF